MAVVLSAHAFQALGAMTALSWSFLGTRPAGLQGARAPHAQGTGTRPEPVGSLWECSEPCKTRGLVQLQGGHWGLC